MIIDCHGHFTTEPEALHDFRRRQIAAHAEGRPGPDPESLSIDDETLRACVEGAQIAAQRQRGTDLTLFSPRAAGMAHHVGDAAVSLAWTHVCNDLIHRICTLFPKNFVGVCQLPQSPGVEPAACVDELVRCVERLGFVGCNINPDPTGGFWTTPPLTDRWWYPLWEAMAALDVPGMIHVSASCNACFHTTGSHYINGDTTAFMQVLEGDLFRDFPTLKFVIPHGGGAVPYHWGRYRGLAQDMGRGPLEDLLLNNVFFDTCVYHALGIELLTRVVPADNILFASEMIGAVRGIDPRTGHHYDDTRRYIDGLATLSAADRHKIFEGNARRVYGRLNDRLRVLGIGDGPPA
ncbi:amidohydrolase family protein [Rhodoplanes sp. TEM]|uniref:Amidohydrolase family protein n=1 Tax=Rhodoplanes tepidamans TaxID=200616 RepID=A0ABT5JDX4_RHOTP|nr:MULTISPECIES: amidohydrolase family protein [Rhodoplanes]MDC7787869.1 amidohydrolase family protein [Rhodoplanes tepidamans]MDC7985672.1 amidohydrolase family protein [Rhodoplanes sp. TEM]MDQ0357868.1 4-oxalmesaconate hydratase [Rhodoplanes tepidamans]